VTGEELAKIRKRCGMGRAEFARALGYEGSDENNVTLLKRMETGKREVVPTIALRAMDLDPEDQAFRTSAKDAE
jgi:transcriptional regulator with XRE-family HTH domain